MDYDEFGNYIGPDQPEEAYESEYESIDEVDSVDEESGAVVLPENRLDHPNPKHVYPDVEIIHAEEDSMDITVPLVKPVNYSDFTANNKIPKVRYDRGFQRELQKTGTHSRVVVVAGAQGNGKTALIDALVEKTHIFTEKALQKPLRFTHAQEYERGRDISVFATPVSLLLQDSKSKSFVVHFIDTPGHSDFFDEVECSLGIADGILLAVSAIEGVTPCTRRVISRAVARGLPMTLVLTQIDRLIIDLRLPPTECYHRLDYILDEVNESMVRAGAKQFEPEDVLFTSAEHRWCFNISSFAQDYPQVTPRHFWGDVFFENGKFISKGSHWSFAELILNPIYKLYTACMSSDEELTRSLQSAGIDLRRSEFKLDYLARLRVIFGKFLEWGPLVDSVVRYPVQQKTVLSKNVLLGDRIMALIRTGEMLKVGDKLHGTIIGEIWLPQAKYHIQTDIVYAGELALLDLVSERPDHVTEPVVKLGIEPVIPAQLPDMLKAVGSALKLFPGLETEVQDSGEHLLFGPGELFLDCVMFFLRKILGSVEIKVSDPATRFRETCAEQSFASCSNALPGGGKITVLASPIPSRLAKELQNAPKQISHLKPMLKAHGWDNMAIRSIWTFGPDSERGTSVFLNDVLGENRSLAEDCRDVITDGFLLSVHQGPLCDEEIQDVQFRLIEFERGSASSGQLIATTRRACYAAFLLASPRLLEPWYEITVIGPLQAGRSIYENLRRRRGKVLDDRPIPGTNLYKIEGRVPVLDSFGLETDIRVATKGQSKVSFAFTHYETTPGDPLDESVKLASMDVATGGQLARDFVLKTRKRKALAPTPSLAKYLDPDAAEILGVS